jgi:hypothetical protein
MIAHKQFAKIDELITWVNQENVRVINICPAWDGWYVFYGTKSETSPNPYPIPHVGAAVKKQESIIAKDEKKDDKKPDKWSEAVEKLGKMF